MADGGLDFMKSKVISYKEKRYEPLSVAWMKELRLHNRTKRVYEVNPYAEVYQFRDHVYAILTDNLDGGYSSWMYLIVEEEQAMLIDTSYGLGNLKGLVDEITGGKPVIVANTHPSFDHSYGNCQFEKAYCHEYGVPKMRLQLNPHIWDYLFDESGRNIWVEFDRKDLVPYKDYEIIGCPDHFTFHLGKDHEVELLWLRGHQPGHCGYLDKKNRILFCGDALISMRVAIGKPNPSLPYSEYSTVEACYRQMAELEKRLGEFDALFPGHFIVDLDTTGVTGMKEACLKVLENPKSYDYIGEMGGNRTFYAKYVKGLGILAYNDNNIYQDGRRQPL